MGLIQAVYQAIKRKGYGVPTPIQRKVNIFINYLGYPFDTSWS